MLTPDEVADIKAALALAQTDIAGWTHSTFLKMADRATHTVFSTVAHVLRIEGIALSGDLQDVTTHLSGGWRELGSVLKSGGKLAFRVHFTESSSTLNMATGLGAAALEQTKERFHIDYVDGTSLEFWAFVDLALDAPVNGRLIGKVVLNITGEVVVL